jgi:hypothetical protein
MTNVITDNPIPHMYEGYFDEIDMLVSNFYLELQLNFMKSKTKGCANDN